MIETKKWLLICVMLGGIIFSNPSAAAQITRTDVEHHLQSMVDLYNKETVDHAEIYEFIKNYMVKEGIYKSNYYTNDAKEPIVRSSSSAQILQAQSEIKDRYISASAKYELIEFTPNNDNETAEVKYKVWHTATLERDVSQEEVGKISFESVADCTETFGLDGTQVKGLKNVCNVQIKQERPVKLKKADAKAIK